MCNNLLLAPLSPVVLSPQGNESTFESRKLLLHSLSQKEGAGGLGTSFRLRCSICDSYSELCSKGGITICLIEARASPSNRLNRICIPH